jgi:putative DNA methylase
MAGGEIITRRMLPHWYVPGAMHFVTYRLAGTIPVEVLRRLRAVKEEKLKRKPPSGQSLTQHRERVHKQFFAEYDKYLDQNCTINWLARPEIAALVRRSLYHHRGKMHHLLAYCVLPNHVHVLLQPVEPMDEPQARTLVATGDEIADKLSPLAKVMQNLKGYTAHEANKLLGRKGQFWQHESYDHWVRDDEELERIVEYIAWNPVKAGLVTVPHEWYFGSAHDRLLHDGSKCGYLSDTP